MKTTQKKPTAAAGSLPITDPIVERLKDFELPQFVFRLWSRTPPDLRKTLEPNLPAKQLFNGIWVNELGIGVLVLEYFSWTLNR